VATTLDPVALNQLRLTLYRLFAETGRAPERERLAGLLSMTEDEIHRGLEELAASRLLVLDAAGDILMAHPFASANFGFSVMGARTLYRGGCAWDAFAIPHLVDHEPRVLIATTCPSCERPLAWNVNATAPPSGREVVRFATPAARAWDDVVTTCQNQRIFCAQTCVDNWVAVRSEDPGTVFDLATLWRLAQGWYAGRLDEHYVRRDPAAAAEYFARVGVPASFWS